MGMIMHLAKLVCKPDAPAKMSSILLSNRRSCSTGTMKMTRSSAYNKSRCNTPYYDSPNFSLITFVHGLIMHQELRLMKF
jgi:hypothetical protein